MKAIQLINLILFLLFSGSFHNSIAANGLKLPDKLEIKQKLCRVADYDIKNFSYSHEGNPFHLHDYGIDGWTNATFFLGLAEWAKTIDNAKADSYYHWLLDIGDKTQWKTPTNFVKDFPEIGIYHADELCIGQFYISMYRKYGDKYMIADIKERIDSIIAAMPHSDLGHENKQLWTWSDALFMAPVIYAQMAAITGDNLYLDYLDKNFKKTYSHLYSQKDSLFYRDDSYLKKKENNGTKIFWGRGNGWVAAGLTNLLKLLPANSPYRPFYENLFIELIVKLSSLQSKDGFWHASLLDPESYPAPETSATSFILYALTYGVNEGLLPADKYYPVIVKSWAAVEAAIDKDGKLGWVQPIGADPRYVTKDMSAVYGTGALLLAGTELIKLAEDEKYSHIENTTKGRICLNFNEGWFFKKGPFSDDCIETSAEPFASDRTILGGFGDPEWTAVTVPHTWNATDMQTDKNNFYTGVCYYRKTYIPSASLKDKRLFLRFEGVASTADVYVNRKFAGKHEGGYSAFVVEISSLLDYDRENEILVKADNSSRPDIIPVNHTLFGVYGGIYRPVSMIITGNINISVTDYASPGVYITQKNISKNSAEVDIQVKLENKNPVSSKVSLVNTIYDTNGKIIDKRQSDLIVLPQGRQIFEQNLTLKNPHLWQGLEDPYLYKVVTQLVSNGEILDEVTQPLGLRHIELRAADGIYLNGKKVPMYGVCRHQDRWQAGSALTKEHHDEDLEMIKEIGATTIRLAHYQQSEYFYAKCDSIGFLVWAEIPFVNRVTTKESGNARLQLIELIRQNYNHPSIYVWGLHNEVYIPVNYTAQLTSDLHDLAKSEDSQRYTISVNGYADAGHGVNMQADIQGINRYFGWYEKRIQDIEPWIESLERNYPHHKIILAEYGAEANIHQQAEDIGDAGHCCGFDKNYNETFATRLHEKQWGYISRHPYIIASYIWNMFDFATPMSSQGKVEARNMKGLVTFDRKIKKDNFYWYKANWSNEPVLYITGRRNNQRQNEYTDINVYSNTGIPVLEVNGKEISNPRQGETNVHYIFEYVQLSEGVNDIKARVTGSDKKFTDYIIWYYSKKDKKTTNNPVIENIKEHTGL